MFVVILALGGVSSIKQKGNEKFKTNVPETAQKRETSSSIEQQTESVEKPDASTELADDFEAWDDGEINTVELAYYLEVQTRVNKKLLEVME